jgi:hypothetical protein
MEGWAIFLFTKYHISTSRYKEASEVFDSCRYGALAGQDHIASSSNSHTQHRECVSVFHPIGSPGGGKG